MNKQLLFQLQKKTFWVTLAVLELAISTQKLSFVDFFLARAIVSLISIVFFNIYLISHMLQKVERKQKALAKKKKTKYDKLRNLTDKV